MSAAAEKEKLAFAALIGGALCIALAPILVRESPLEPVSTAFFRMALSLPLFAVWAWVEAPPLRGRTGEADRSPSRGPERTPARIAGLLVGSGLFFAGDLALWHWSIALTSVANATLLANLAPVFVTAYAGLVLKERVTGRFLMALLLALAGAALLARASQGAGGRHLLGDFLGVATAVFYAGYLLTVKEARRWLPTARVMAASSFVSCLPLFLIAWISAEGFRPGSVRGWTVLLALAWVSQGAGQGLIALGLKRLPASFSSVTLLVQPAAAALLAWLLLGEALGGWQVLGGIAIVAGVLLARRGVRTGAT